MSFHSVNFILFIGVVWVLYLLVSNRYRWALLLLASIVFYASQRSLWMIVALFLVIAICHVCGKQLETSENDSHRRRWLWFGIIGNLLALLVFKYGPAVMATVSRAQLFHDGQGLFSTLGVSYFTVQAIGYLIEVYQGEIEAEHHLGYLALYICFFPKLLQGPIERGSVLIPQLRANYDCSRKNLRRAALLFTWGLFKKIVVANRLAPYVAMVYGDVHSHTGLQLFAATYFYSIQIYADFSGYTDMALGVALMFNIELTQNFRMPYLAESVADFWRRWHISFSSWLFRYIFQPLQISWRGISYGTPLALLATFFISGLWHGVSWGFVVWGLLHGIFLVICYFWPSRSKPAKNARGKFVRLSNQALRVFVTFNLVTFAWIFFRAQTIADAWYVVTHLFTGIPIQPLSHGLVSLAQWMPVLIQGTTKTSFLLMIVSVIILLIPALVGKRVDLLGNSGWYRYAVYYILLLSLVLLGVSGDKGFVYFQF